MSVSVRFVDGPVATVAVTGAAGFVGSAVMRACARRGLDAVGLVRACEVGALPPSGGYRVVDWTDRQGLSRMLKEVHPAHIVHCAGATARAGENPETLHDANVGLVESVLSSASELALPPGIVILSSAAVYGPSPPTPTSEDAPLVPVSAYAASKVEAESVARRFAESAGLRVSIARPFNVLGKGEPPGSVVQVIASQILAAQRDASVTVRLRECRSIRDYVDVDDVADALLAIAERGEHGEAYNVCSGIGVSVAELVERAARVWGRTVSILTTEPDSPATVSIGTRDRIAALGWTPLRTLDETLAHLGHARQPAPDPTGPEGS